MGADYGTSDNKLIKMGDFLDALLKGVKPDTDGGYYFGLINVLHQAVHEKKMHTISYTKESVASDGSLFVRIIAGANKDIHTRISFSGEGKTRLKSYKGTTYTGNGTLYVPFNRQTKEPNNLEATVYIDPVIDTLGEQRGNDFVGSGAAGARAGGTGNGEIETIINAGTELLIEIVNASNATSDLGCIVNLYERNKFE